MAGAKKGKEAAKKDTSTKADSSSKGKGKGKSAASGSGDAKVKGAQSINVRHILCEKHSKKEEAVAKLRDGAKFDDVAREFSEDKARQGGSLGWKSRGDLDPTFTDAAFEIETSSTGNPTFGEVKTGFGYHIFMVEGRK